jgi:RsiW-degrading membrane proteinase PrsW (M82 family)
MTGSRFLVPGAALAATLGSIAFALFAPVDPGPFLVVAAVGPPVTALLLAAAVSGGASRSLVPSALIGAVAVPVLVLLAGGALAAVVFGLVEPLAAAGRELLDELRVDPTLLGVLSSPWAVVLLVHLAVAAPLIEEALKPLGSLARRPQSARDAFLFGVAAGAGFAAVENLLYASGWFLWGESWLAVSLLRSVGAAVHPLGAGLVSLGVWTALRARRPGAAVASFGAAAAIHALWNGSIAVTLVLFNERDFAAGGLGGTAFTWGVTLTVLLVLIGGAALAGLVGLARRVAGDGVPDRLLPRLSASGPRAIVAWASAAALLLVPAAILILEFPDFLAL